MNPRTTSTPLPPAQPRGLGSQTAKQGTDDRSAPRPSWHRLKPKASTSSSVTPAVRPSRSTTRCTIQQAAAPCARPPRAGRRCTRPTATRAPRAASACVIVTSAAPAPPNTVTGIATAYMDTVPLVVITGQVPRGVIGTDSVPGIRHRRHHHAGGEAQLPAAVHRRAHHAPSARRSISPASGRPGPVLIDVPSDLASAEKMVFDYPDKVNLPSYQAPPTSGNAKQIRAAVQRDSPGPSAPCSTSAAASSAPGATDELVELADSHRHARWSPRSWARARFPAVAPAELAARWACTARSTPTWP